MFGAFVMLLTQLLTRAEAHCWHTLRRATVYKIFCAHCLQLAEAAAKVIFSQRYYEPWFSNR